MKSGTTVVLAAGDFPRKGGDAWDLLSSACRVVACDSAARAFRRRFGRWPDVIVGDLDSLGRCPKGVDVVRVSEQETNDLEKALALCERRGWKRPIVVGATGKREDHMIGNVFRCLERGVEIVTDRGRFVPLCGRTTLEVVQGAAISVFATDRATRMTSHGLEWPLDGVAFDNLYCATLNRAVAARVVIVTTKPAYAYIAS